MSKECCKRWRFATGAATLSVMLLSVSVQAQVSRDIKVIDTKTGELSPRQTVKDISAEQALFGPSQVVVSNQNLAAGITATGNIGEAVVYQNGVDSGFGVIDNYTPTTGLLFPGTLNADNLGLEGGYVGLITRYEMAVFRSANDPLTGLGLATDLHIALWDGDPLASIDTLGYAGGEVAGSGGDFTLPANGNFLLSHTLPKGSGATNPANRFWGTLSASQGANPSSCRLFFILTLVKPTVGNDDPGDIWENQFDNQAGDLPLSCCGDRGTVCAGAGGVCGPTGEGVLCDDGDADGAFIFSFGGPCTGDNATDSCSNYLWNVYAPAAVTMDLVEAGTGASEVILTAGGVDVSMEVRISNFDPNANGTLLKAWEADIDSSGYTSALAGTLTPTAPACASDSDCKAIFGGVCGITAGPCLSAVPDCPLGNIEGCSGSTCSFPTGVGGQCAPGYIFTGLADYVFKQAGGDLPAVDVSTQSYRYASATTVAPLPSSSATFPAYLGSLQLSVSAGAAGTFTVPFLGVPKSVLVDQNNQFIPLIGFNPGKITVEVGQCCDLSGGAGNFVCLNDDGTKASCDAVGGVFNSALTCADACGCVQDSDCDDGDACTVDTCAVDSTCDNSVPTDCSDGLVCTDDVCDSATGCANPATNVDDGDGCTTDACTEATGVTNTPVVIDDGSPCTFDSCDSATGIISNDEISTFACTTLADCPAGATGCDGAFCECKLDIDLTYVIGGGTCAAEGSKVVVDVVKLAGQNIAGVQWTSFYDPTCLQLNSVTTGIAPYVTTLGLDDSTPGEIFVAVGVDAFGSTCSAGTDTLASYSFTKIGSCNECNLCFGGTNPSEVRASDCDGQSVGVTPTCSDVIRDNDNVTISGSGDVTSNADCDNPTAAISFDTVTASSSCGPVTIACTGVGPNGENMDAACSNGSGVFPVGTTNCSCTATSNWCPGGKSASHSWSITVSDAQSIDVTVQLSPLIVGDVTRCIKFGLYADCVTPPTMIERTLFFGGNFQHLGHFVDSIKAPIGQYICITARDQLHTLRACDFLTCAGGSYGATFKGDPFFGGNWLVGGNLDGWKKGNPEASQDVIDITDFGQFVANFGTVTSANTPCTQAGGFDAANADINGDGFVNGLDFSYVSQNFLSSSKACCCGSVATLGNTVARTEISVRELRAMGMGDLAVADLNNDGVLNEADMAAYTAGTRPVKQVRPKARQGSGARR